MSKDNLLKMFSRATIADINEGLLAYPRYHDVVQSFADCYSVSFEKTLAAFVALSPNNDYLGNLRSLASVLHGYSQGTPLEGITVSTYNHCRDRAFSYVTGEKNFLDSSKGLKIRAFYFNILDPMKHDWVTIDGHMKAVWDDEEYTMKEAIVGTKREYLEIQQGVKDIAFDKGIRPNQLQSILWFTRKRYLNVIYDNQFNLFRDPTDTWRTIIKPEEAPPYANSLKVLQRVG